MHTTLAPAFVDRKSFADMAAWLEPGGTWFLQQYNSEDCLNPIAAGVRRYTDEELEEFAAVARTRHEKIAMSGMNRA